MERAFVEQLTEMAVDPEDRLAIREFAQLSWLFTGTGDPSKSALMRSNADRRYSWMRTMQSRGRPLPRPVGGSSRAALYRLGDLVDWVKEHDSSEVVFDPQWTLWRASRAFADEEAGNARPRDPTPSDATPLDRLRRFLVGLVLLCAPEGDHVSIGAAMENELLRDGDDLPGRLHVLAAGDGSESGLLAARLLGLVPTVRSGPVSRAARSVAAVLLSGDAIPSLLVDLLFEHLSGLPVRAGATTTGRSLARLVSGLGDPKSGERVIDPACGEGQLLLAAARLRGATDFVGRDTDGDALLTARAVFKINGFAADFGDGPTNSLAAATELPEADLVLLDPPLGGGLHVAKWLKLAARLTPTGRAVVVLPGDSLRSGRREWPTVSERVVSVIACPPKVRTDTGEAPAAWVLGHGGKDKVLVVDASSARARTFDVKNADLLADAINAWSTAGRWDPPLGVHGREIPRAAIEAAGGELRLDALPPTSDGSLELRDGPIKAFMPQSVHTGFRLRSRTLKVLHLLLEELNEDPFPETEELRTAIANFLADNWSMRGGHL